MKAELYNQKNEKVGEIELPEKIFGVKWNADLIHQALIIQLMNRRENLAHTKGRGEVRGGGKKPWKQKGTGRARHGSIRSPLWKGGGVTFGPNQEENFARKINKKMKKMAIFSVLSKKTKNGELKIIEGLGVEKPKTKIIAAILKNILGNKESLLVVASMKNRALKQSVSNIPRAGIIGSQSLNVYDLLRYKNILLEKDAISEIENHYLKAGK